MHAPGGLKPLAPGKILTVRDSVLKPVDKGMSGGGGDWRSWPLLQDTCSSVASLAFSLTGSADVLAYFEQHTAGVGFSLPESVTSFLLS